MAAIPDGYSKSIAHYHLFNTDNYGATFCTEFFDKCELPNNLMVALAQKVTNYLSSTTNNNEFIIGFTIRIETTIQLDVCTIHALNNVYVITNYGNIYKIGYHKIVTNIDLNRYIVLPDKSDTNLFYSGQNFSYALYVTLEKIVITNKILYDSEIDEIKKNTLIIRSRANCLSNFTDYSLTVQYLYQPPNTTFNCGGRNEPTYSSFLDINLVWCTQIVLNHERIRVLNKIITENFNVIDELKKLISQKKKKIIVTPEHFNCPVSADVMEEPVIAMDGHTYNRASIEMWLQNHNTSPMTREIISTNLVPNFNLKSQIDEWYKSN
jgi:hypothetical protein